MPTACPGLDLPRLDGQHGGGVRRRGDGATTAGRLASVESRLEIEKCLAVCSEGALESNGHGGRQYSPAVQEVRQGGASHIHALRGFRDGQAPGQNVLPYVEAGMRGFLWTGVHETIVSGTSDVENGENVSCNDTTFKFNDSIPD